ncbi:ATP-dependent DNA helicase UvrD2 [Actinomyces minihominis]|uniref:ATP-dependent DNA helicase UvrD2 n=1 Tax=Actinomyces minihominis TaxID=2002838 RepID=UPI000C06F2B7|nr:ATP-dependent DNA helicase UvrD2 [Actinomyces minihominis]
MIGQGSPEELLDALDPQQREVALQVSGPLCVRAGAGTGKTRAITYRIAYGNAVGAVDPGTVLAVTFTSKAAAEMAVRLRELGAGRAQAMTFHGAALKQLGYFWPRVTGGPLPNLMPHKAGVVASAASRVGVRADRLVVRDLAAEVEWAKVSMVGPEGYEDYARKMGRTPPADLDLPDFSRFYEAYEQAKSDRNAIDFEDVLLLQCGMLEDREDVARSVRARYRNFVVDEYQDVSPVQQHLLDLWRGERTDICVVGDVAQTIYSFTGASARYLEEFPKRMKGARVVQLVRDYRSTPQVVALANQVVASAKGMDGKSRSPGLPGAVRLQAQRPMGPAVTYDRYDHDLAEAEGIAEKIRGLRQQGVALSEIAVLYRVNAQSEAFEEVFSDAGIPFQVHGGSRFFDREEVKRAILLIRQQARVRTLAGQETSDLVGMVAEVIGTLGWQKKAPATAGAVRDRWANLDALLELARRNPDRSPEQFVSELEERSVSKAAPTVEGVVLSTLHAAKGLEWDAVFLAGLSEGLMPISLATTAEGVEEERRLLYVGITRAREHLCISYSLARSADRKGKRAVSRFLSPMWPRENASRGRWTASGSKPASIGKPKTSDLNKLFLDSADEETRELFEELRQWRLGVSREVGKPAYTILTDAALRGVAEAKPRTLKQLGALRGIGAVKLENWGTPLLRMVRGYLPD